jgi:hypothetical protein
MWLFRCCGCCDCCPDEVLNAPIDSFDNFSYRGVTEAPHLQITLTYQVFNRGRQGIILYNLTKRTDNKRLQVGWKFHIAVNAQDIERAWNLIKDIIIKENIVQTKLIAKEYLEQMEEAELGREITIYAFKEDDDMEWRPIIDEIEHELATAGIPPGITRCPIGLPIPGRGYFTCRCDQRRVPEQYRYMSERDFYTSNSISKRLLYIEIDEAQRIAEETGTQSYNPYDFAVPDFITRLITITEEPAIT